MLKRLTATQGTVERKERVKRVGNSRFERLPNTNRQTDDLLWQAGRSPHIGPLPFLYDFRTSAFQTRPSADIDGRFDSPLSIHPFDRPL